MTVPHDCPTCGASVPADAAWCSLCFARFDVFDPLTAPLDQVSSLDRLGGAALATQAPATEVPAPQRPVVDPLRDPIEEVAGELVLRPSAAPGGTAAAGASNPETAPGRHRSAAPPDLDAVFARIAAEYPQADPLSSWAERLADRSNRVVVMVVGSLGAAVVLFGLLSVLSLLG